MSRSARFTLEDVAKLSPTSQKEVQAQLYGSKCCADTGKGASATPKPSGARLRLRQDSNGLNKTEAAFFAYLKTTQPGRHHEAQAITLKIANGCRYSPDFVSFSVKPSGWVHIDAWETKGFFRDDAAVKLKVAARQFPFITFHLVTRKNGAWKIETVLP